MARNISSDNSFVILMVLLALFLFSSSLPVHAEATDDEIKNTSETILETPETRPPPPTPKPSTLDNDPYRLNAGDHLRIFVFGVEDLTGEFRVNSKGHITMPLIGELLAEGLNKAELESLITAKLIEGEYYKNPKVTVEIIALMPFYILGEVRTPGSYPYEPDLDVFKAIAIAGGYTPRATKDNVLIIRKIHGEKVRIQANEDTPVLPGDSIKVKQRFF